MKIINPRVSTYCRCIQVQGSAEIHKEVCHKKAPNIYKGLYIIQYRDIINYPYTGAFWRGASIQLSRTH